LSVIEGSTSKGLGVASQLGFPTINLYQTSDDCGVYMVADDDLGIGVAFVMPELTEIHFLGSVDNPPDYISCRVLQKIPPHPNGILDYFYRGLEHDSSRNS